VNPAEFASLTRTEEKLWWFRGMRSILFKLLDSSVQGRKIETVLEAGCGTGYLAGKLHSRYGWTVVAADLASQAFSLKPQTRRVLPVQADIARAPFGSGLFDAVLCLDVLVHFSEGEENRPIAEFARMLRRGGLLVIRVSALNILRSRHSMWADERQRFTRGRLTRAVSQHGFRILRCTYANSLLLPVAAAKFRIWEPITRQQPASGTGPLPEWLDTMLYLPLAIEKLIIGKSVPLPLGQTLLIVAERL
jgi:SAM-dependent methyltransferase